MKYIIYMFLLVPICSRKIVCRNKVCDISSDERVDICSQPIDLTDYCVCHNSCDFITEFDVICTKINCWPRTTTAAPATLPTFPTPTPTSTPTPTPTTTEKPESAITALNQALISVIVILVVMACMVAFFGPKLYRWLKRNDFISENGIPYGEEAVEEDGIPVHPFTRAPLLGAARAAWFAEQTRNNRRR